MCQRNHAQYCTEGHGAWRCTSFAADFGLSALRTQLMPGRRGKQRQRIDLPAIETERLESGRRLLQRAFSRRCCRNILPKRMTPIVDRIIRRGSSEAPREKTRERGRVSRHAWRRRQSRVGHILQCQRNFGPFFPVQLDILTGHHTLFQKEIRTTQRSGLSRAQSHDWYRRRWNASMFI